MLEGRIGGKASISFDGVARIANTSNFPIQGEIEVRDDAETPRVMRDRWKAVPECIEGYAELSLEDDLPPRMFLTLYCTSSFLAWVSNAFSAGFSNSQSAASVVVSIGYPDEIGPDFWIKQWQTEILQVHEWRVCGGSRTI
jgi:hypothetical protein